ncbi:hypothetical protein KSP40_PGU021122 [Platanthera guangdongensis]|uniref:Uncharacterized protein n=1 Tax=Platanthera guangdongensis TaxID=2320717 RepID=A0ABR2M9G8_9ASPA
MLQRGISLIVGVSATIFSGRALRNLPLSGSRIGSNFALFDIASPPGGYGGKDHSSSPYATILQTVIFGSDHNVVPPVTPDRCSSSPSLASSTSLSSPRRNIFRFKAEVPRYSISSVVFDDALPAIVPSQPKETRKVPKSP